MVGRVGPLSRLVGLVEAAEVASGDEPAIGLVSGEPGIGKTRLLNEFAANPAGLAAAPLRTPVEVLRAHPGSLERPFDAVGALLERLDVRPVGCRDIDPQQAVLGDVAEHLREGPVVLAVEDVHWIDADSAALVDRLSRQPWPGLVIICSYRSGALRRGSPGGELVARLERGHTTEQLRLERLDRQEVAALVNAITGDQPTSALVDAVMHRSEGIPFVVEELVRAVRRRPDDDDVAAAVSSIELPWSLSDAVRQQLGELRHDQRRIVEALAVFDDSASFEVIRIVTELTSDALLVALRDLVGEGIIDEVGDDRFWFTHALTADTVSGGLIGRERRRLHRRCLVALGADDAAGEERGRRTDHAALIRHAIGAGRFEDVGRFAKAGAQAALDAGRTFLALRLASQGLEEECDDIELLAVATEAAWRLDFLDEAAAHATRWASVASGPGRVDALRMLSRVSFERHELELAETALRQLVAIAEGNADPLAVRAAAEAALAQLCMFTHRTDEAVRWGDQAIVHATAAGDEITAVRAAVERASARAWLVPPHEARRELRVAIDGARDAKDFVSTARGLGNLLVVVPDHSAEGRAIVTELQQLVRRAGFDKLGAVAAMRTCEMAIGLGDLAGARRALAQWWSSWMQAGIGDWVTTFEAFIAIEEGRFSDGETLLTVVSAPGTHLAAAVAVNDDPFTVTILWLVLAGLSNDRTLGARAFHELVDIESDWSCSFAWLLAAVEGALAVDVDPSQVRKEILDRRLGRPMPDDARSYLEGLIAVAERRHRDAVALLEPLVGDGTADEVVGATSRALLRTALAKAYLGAGDRARALSTIDVVIGSDLGRWPGVRRDRAEVLRRRLAPVHGDRAERSANAADAGPGGGLTRREREVAALLSDGLTNGQLAERLYISPKTAAVHVSNILAKLGLSSRAEIAAWAVRNLGDLAGAR